MRQLVVENYPKGKNTGWRAGLELQSPRKQHFSREDGLFVIQSLDPGPHNV